MKALIAIALLAACGGPPPPVEPEIPQQKKPDAAPTVIEWDKLVGPVKTVDVHGGNAVLVAKVQELAAPAIGKPVERHELRGVLSSIFEAPGVADVSAKAIQLVDGVTLELDVTPEPTLHALVAREATGRELNLPTQIISAAVGQPVEPAMLDDLGVRMHDDYLANGFADATIAWKQAAAGSDAVDVALEVTPGKLSTITAVDFKGNSHAKKADLVKALGDGFKANSPWNVDVVARGTLLVTSYYFDHGYVNVAVDEPPPPGAPAPLVYTITEGDQFRIGKLEVANAPPTDAKKYLALVGVREGQVFNRSAIADGLTKINAALKAAGQADVRAVPITNVDPKKKTIDLKFEIQKS